MAIVRSGRSALSIYRARERFNRFTLIDVELKTGRTHQIRVHLAWIKHPVVGDETYGSGRDNTVADPRIRGQISKLGRQFLHAEKLGFIHPKSRERLNFTSPLPGKLQNLLNTIRSE
jgi:23S rRNA pseudouridine1911/1915/1917 synthase